MPRTKAVLNKTDIRNVVDVAKDAGATAVEVRLDGTVVMSWGTASLQTSGDELMQKFRKEKGYEGANENNRISGPAFKPQKAG